MKKVSFVVMLVIVLSLLLAACGGSTTPEPVEPTSAPAVEEPAVEEPTEAPAAEEPAAEEPAAEEPTEAPAVEEPTEEPAAEEGMMAQSGGDLTVLVKQLPAEMGNIHTTFGSGLLHYILPVVETLVGVTPNGLEPTKLATGWEFSDDGLALTFYLREGVKFHDGTDFNAEAVKWNLDKFRETKAELEVITSVDVVDDYTVVLTLSDPSNTILTVLSGLDGVQISPASVDGQTDEFVATNIVGTGPFTLGDFQVDTSVVYTAFADYWEEGQPYVDSIEFLVVPDQNTAQTAFLAGDANVWDYLDARNAPPLVEQGLTVNVSPGLARVMMPDSVNEDSPFYHKEVRQAFEYAIDKQAIADAFGYGTWVVMPGPCAPSHVGCDAALENERTYDPAKAKELLAAAGYPDGFEMTLYSVGSIDDEMLTAIQAYLADVGIMATYEKPDSATGQALHTDGWKDAVYLQGLSVASPSYAASLLKDGPQAPGKSPVTYYSEEYLALLDQASTAKTAEAELEASRALIRYIQEDNTFIPLIVASRNAALGLGVHCDIQEYNADVWNPGACWIEQ